MTTITQNGQVGTTQNSCIMQESGAAVQFYVPDIDTITRIENVLFGEAKNQNDTFTKTETVVITNV